MAKVRYVLLFLLLGVATMTTLMAAFQQAPVSTVGCALLALVTARFTVPQWLNIHSERRRFREQTQERQESLTARETEYERWKNKLEELRPGEEEMEGWLDADKTLILSQALKHYRLAWYEVIAHAFLPTPDRPCKSAHVPRGPWRHSRYEIRIFLVTDEGVREATADLDFERGHWQRSERDNYRFDALSSVQVEIANARHYTLNITLTNGPIKEIPVSDIPTHDTMDEAPQGESSEINLDAAGFSHTLRILEGIAAEGKPWFDREAEPPPGPVPPSAAMGWPPGPDGPAPAGNAVVVSKRSSQPIPG